MNSVPFLANPNPSVTETELGQVSNPSQPSHNDTHHTLTLVSPSIVRTSNSKSNPSPSPSANLPSLRRMRLGRSPLPSLVLGETLTHQPERVWGRNTKHVHDMNPYPYALTSTPNPKSKALSAHPNLHLLSTTTAQLPTSPPPPPPTYAATASQAAALAEASVRALTSFELPPTVTTATTTTTYQESPTSMWVESKPDPIKVGKANEIEAAALNFIRQRGQVDLPSDEGKGELLPESPYSHSLSGSGSGSGDGLRYTPYVGGSLTSSESALVQEIQALVAINSQLNEAVEQVEQQQRDEQVRLQAIMTVFILLRVFYLLT